MGKDIDLLRLLEPVVRPGNLPAPSRAAAAPVEEQSFAILLEGARERASTRAGSAQEAIAAPSNSHESAAPSFNPLAILAGPDRIENSALRSLLAQHRESTNPQVTSPTGMPA